jgi:hypothetical protein
MPWRLLAAAVLLATAGGAQAVGRAEVRFVDPQGYTDAGFGAIERERTQRQLAAHFDRLARRLPDGQVLKVAMLDIDLAGELDTLAFDHVRVLGRLPDRPRLAMSFQVLAGDRVLEQGETVLTDSAYLERGPGRYRDQPLAYERRLLDDWFAAQVAPKAGAAR